MKAIGIILVILGLVGFVLGGVTFTQTEEVADLGSVEVEREEQRAVNIPPLVSGGAVAVGLAFIVAGFMKPKEDTA